MFILKRQDVEISSIQHPKKDQQVPILHYQGQAFRLISVFKAGQEEEARALWRELTDNRGKACVLLEEPERFSVWGKVRLEQIENETGGNSKSGIFIQASILLLQAVHMDIEDFLGTKQASLFEKDITEVLKQQQFPETNTIEAIKYWVSINPLEAPKLPPWKENHVVSFLQELHKLGKTYFGNANFANQVADKLQEMPEGERSLFLSWLNQSSLSKLWQ
ncbi:Npun_F0813 family protein [Anabaena sp. CA = ATCC 33047]|uniref:Npun_F0813 family protein n=1 Tax=Anabaena sp. (strain CA / ATCC 33047) TaxID=52271 RepID=UPI00083740CF|nr:Npun_F0813 family protein [Anabaena sp. CA = ATCC 33047]